MVHKKFIKRDGKVFGPYLYENYRENGITKTRYMGIGKRDRKKQIGYGLLIFLGLLFALIIANFYLFEGPLVNLDFEGKLFNQKPVDVFVEIIDNHSPEIIIDEVIYRCENTQKPYYFNVTDVDGDDLDSISLSTLSSRNPFHIFDDDWLRVNLTTIQWKMSSDVLVKEYVDRERIDGRAWAVYNEKIEVTDIFGGYAVDILTIEIIEVNNPPIIEDIEMETLELWTFGDANIFNYTVQVNDIEDGDQDGGILKFNLTFLNGVENLFDISPFGNMYFNATNKTDLLGVYDLNISVNDSGLQNTPHFLINDVCLNDGWGSEPLEVSKVFKLIITNRNRAPEIISYYPNNSNFTAAGVEELYFNVTSYDADWNFTDVYWYVDGLEEEFDSGFEGSTFEEFRYSFGCGISGEHNISLMVTDGLANASKNWNISVSGVACSVPESSGGGGGGGGGSPKLYCEVEWVCGNWDQCQNYVEVSQELDQVDASLIQGRCDLFKWQDNFCGFQKRACWDSNKCGNFSNAPPFLRECYYTENPTCEDGIKNCHDGNCEVLVDCGGPCNDCPNCHDGIQNQNEMGIDCGGACRDCIEVPFLINLFQSGVTYTLIVIGILLVILVIMQLVKYKSFKRMIKSRNIKKTIHSEPIKQIAGFFVILTVVASIIVFSVIIEDPLALVSPGLGIGTIAGPAGLGSHSLISMISSNLGFFVTGPIIGDGGVKLTISDDTDGPAKYHVGDEVGFYATYTEGDGSEVSGGVCQIRFYDYLGGITDWNDMIYNEGLGRFENLTSFQYKGIHNFEVQCFVPGPTKSVSSVEEFEITNTVVKFKLNTVGEDYWGVEDELFIYDFSKNITDPDINDEFTYVIMEINTYSHPDYIPIYPWISLNLSTGILIINSTIDNEATDFDMSIRIYDTDIVGPTNEFYFYINETNDAPIFENLNNVTFTSGELFENMITVTDEENNIPFKFEINSLGCTRTEGNCEELLIEGTDYFVDETLGILNISFIPDVDDLGEYKFNFSVMDNSSLGNKTTSMTVNFTVQPSVWDSPIITEYSLTEDDVFSAIDLISMIKPIPIYQSTVTFSYTCEYDFPSFNIDDADVLGAGNIPEFTPRDADVGENLVEITANVTLVGGEVLSAVKVFNFTVFYISDDPILKLPINIDGGSFNSDHFEVLENVDATFKLFVQDWDFSIPQKSFYNEVLDITETIVGPNDTLIKFGEGEFSEEDLAIKRYEADFTSRDMDVGDYNITLEVTDANGASETVEFNLTIIDVIYGLPVIYLPLENHEFNFEEGVEENLEFKANHTIGDNLSYSWYINDILRYSEISFGDGRVQNWLFTPNYVDETYGEKINLTLIVSNPIYPNLNTTRIWNLTIAHRNEPINFSADLIDDFDLAYNANDEFDLKTYFSDADYEDEAYKQNVSFFISSNIVPSRVNRGRVSENWTFILSALEHVSFYEVLNITGCDLNETIVEDVLVVENISCVTSNNFIVNFTDPQLIQIQVPAPSPSPSGGGGGAATNKIISLKLIMPGRISAFENDKIDVPLELTNKGTVAFHGLNLSNVAFKDGDIANEVETLLDQTFFETLAVGESKNLTLSILFNTDKLGDYEVLINISSKTPKYSDWGKMYINLQRINESEVRELLIFTEALIVENPQCIEISEVIEEANNHFKEGDFTSARIKAEKAINACRESIAQVSVPRKESTSFKFLIYLIIGVIISFISGILFYFVQRWRISRKIGKIQQAPIDKKIQKI